MRLLKHPYILLFLKLLFTAFVLYVIFRTIAFKEILQLFSEIEYIWLIPAIFFFALSKFFSSVRLFKLFQSEQLAISHTYNRRLYLLGMFYNFFLPGGIGGDGYKIYKIQKDYSYSYKRVSKVIIADRLSGLIALCNLSAILYECIVSDGYSLITVLFVCSLNFFFYAYLQKKLRLPAFTIRTEQLSWLVQISQCLCAYFIVQSLLIQNHIPIYLFIFLISSIASLFPLSIGGLGAREYTFLWAASVYPIEQEKAVCIGLLFYLISLLISSFGGYFIFKPISKHVSYAWF